MYIRYIVGNLPLTFIYPVYQESILGWMLFASNIEQTWSACSLIVSGSNRAQMNNKNMTYNKSVADALPSLRGILYGGSGEAERIKP